jgi:hypothetical protein
MFILVHSFEGSSSWSSVPLCVGALTRHHIMVGAHGKANYLHNETGSEEKRKETMVHNPLCGPLTHKVGLAS